MTWQPRSENLQNRPKQGINPMKNFTMYYVQLLIFRVVVMVLDRAK